MAGLAAAALAVVSFGLLVTYLNTLSRPPSPWVGRAWQVATIGAIAAAFVAIVTGPPKPLERDHRSTRSTSQLRTGSSIGFAVLGVFLAAVIAVVIIGLMFLVSLGPEG